MAAKETFTAGTTLPEIAEQVASGIAFITRTASPLLAAIGFPGNVEQVFNVRHEFLEEELLPNSTTLTGTHDAAVTTINVATGTAGRFRVGDVVQVDGSRELMRVATVASDSFPVDARGEFGSTAETYVAAQVIKRMHTAATESGAARAARPVSRVRRANYTQIFKDTAEVTRSERLVRQLGGIQDELDQQIRLIEKDLIRDVAHAMINGKAEQSNPEGTTAQARTMDGIIHSILAGSAGDASIVDAAGATLDEALMNTGLQDSWEKGGSPNMMFASPSQKRAISVLAEGRERFGPGDDALGIVIERFMSDFGIIGIADPDFFIPVDTVLILDMGRIEPVKLGDVGDPFEKTPIGKTGTTDQVEVVGEFGLEIKNAQDGGHVLIHNLG